MKQKTLRRFTSVLLLLATMLTGCSQDDPQGEQLPAGKYPITFTAEVEGLTATKSATRGTADNSWGGEQIAIQIGNQVKEYTAAADGALTSTAPFFWQNTTETKKVSGWYPYLETKPTKLTVSLDQTTDYQASDMIYASQEISFKSSSLTFKHLPVKILVNLKHGEGVTADQVKAATVSIVNQASEATIGDNWSVTQATSGNKSITPNALTTATDGYDKTAQALLVPQQMQGKQFIKVTIGTGDYYYTPTESEANLESGKQHTYNITVKKTGLEVSADTSVSWSDGSLTGEPSDVEDYQIHLKEFTAPTNTSDYFVVGDNEILAGSNGIYTIKTNEISISLTADADYQLKTFLTNVTAGVCKQNISYNDATRTYTYTFSDIRSDIWLSDIVAEAEAIADAPAAPIPGNYYYEDGTWSSDLNEGKKCIGIVFKAGADVDDNLTNYKHFFRGGKINGYVLALYDANEGNTCQWGSSDTNVGTIGSGYANTNTIKTYAINNSQSLITAFPATYHATVGYETSHRAPDNSSGWFLPSNEQCFDWINNINVLLGSMKEATSNADYAWKDWYWSSTAFFTSSGSGAFYLDLDSKTVYYGNKDSLNFVRSVLAF